VILLQKTIYNYIINQIDILNTFGESKTFECLQELGPKPLKLLGIARHCWTLTRSVYRCKEAINGVLMGEEPKARPVPCVTGKMKLGQ
jgi:hypothetical protein